jgi:hypothetical protein
MTPPATQTRGREVTWGDIPPLVTCSYRRYEREMGTAVRITRTALRGVGLPNPAYTDEPHWPTVRALYPGDAYFHKGLPGGEFRDLYLADLDRRVALIESGLRAIPVEHGRLCLLCFEVDVTTDQLVCHRRMFAEWWTRRTGRDVPELSLVQDV